MLQSFIHVVIKDNVNNIKLKFDELMTSNISIYELWMFYFVKMILQKNSIPILNRYFCYPEFHTKKIKKSYS